MENHGDLKSMTRKTMINVFNSVTKSVIILIKQCTVVSLMFISSVSTSCVSPVKKQQGWQGMVSV
jgi:hypothetical protein